MIVLPNGEETVKEYSTTPLITRRICIGPDDVKSKVVCASLNNRFVETVNMQERRLIEDYLPIKAISAEASREKSVRKGHISTLHLWWARRPLVACRAAVYGSLVPADQFRPEANAARFVSALCKYPGSPKIIEQAQQHILEAHAARLTAELAEAQTTGKWPGWVEEFKWPKDKPTVTREDIEAGRAPRPRVLDMFAGGGAIPLEALRLGCEAYAMDLNPVAYIILLCTLVYPQKYGKPDPRARGMTGPKGPDGHPTWGGLAEEVRYWGNWVLERVRKEIGDLYPPIPDPEYKGRRPEIEFDRETGRWVAKAEDAEKMDDLFGDTPAAYDVPPGYLTPVAYLWTRTVPCKNPACGATVPLVRQTWLCKKKGGKKSPGRYVALRMVAPKGEKKVRFEVVESGTEEGLGFDPAGLSSRGNATCPFCGTVADIDHVKGEGWAGRMNRELMAIACTRTGKKGKVYVSVQQVANVVPDDDAMRERMDALCQRTGLSAPNEPIAKQPTDSRDNTLGITVRPYGIRRWADFFTRRQCLSLLTLCKEVAAAKETMIDCGYSAGSAKAAATCLSALVARLADYNSTGCVWEVTGEFIAHTFGRQVVTMVWDFVELAPFGDASGSPSGALEWILAVIDALAESGEPGNVERGSAMSLPWQDGSFDAVITDPPYYDNVPYADISDFFYVWHRRCIGPLYAEHFASEETPKKSEAIANAGRHGGDADKARAAYEAMIGRSFSETHRTLKPKGQVAVVYAHKTTLGWATLVDALRQSGFVVTEAWPLSTERPGRLREHASAALASSIFLVARKREAGAGTGLYETQVRPHLESIVRERVRTLWNMDVSGADLVIACVGAGLRAFTQYDRVEYANGEEVPAARFLAEVETVVLDTIFEKLSQEAMKGLPAAEREARAGSLAGVDPATRFYILWRYTYRASVLDAGEAIVFANGTHVELDGPGGLSYGSRPLVEKRKGKYYLLDYAQRGKDAKLGLPQDGQPAPLIDVLHRTLWLMENRPAELADFLGKSGVNLEQLRLVAQALAGPALKGGELAGVSHGSELAALARLTANWRALTEGAGAGPLF